MTTKTRRRRGRREVILEAAAELFVQYGVANTGINDIGSAAGITGPGVYRHFESKSAILSAIGAQALDQFLPRLDEIASADDEPWVTLEKLVCHMADAILADRAAVAVLFSEQKQFEPRFGARVKTAHARHMQVWVESLRRVYPALPDRHLRRAADGVYGMLLALAEGDPTPDHNRLRAIYTAMAMAALRNIPREAP